MTRAHALSLLPARWRSWALGYAAALLAVTLVSLFIGLVLGEVNLANVSMLYLLAVMASAVGFGRGPAIFASVSAFLIFDWFFVQPFHQFTVSDASEWVSLLFFLLTATVMGQLAAGQRQRADEAQQRQREAVVLYDLVRLLTEGDPDQVLDAPHKTEFVLVSDVMRPAVTVRATATLREVAYAMLEHEVEAVAVIDGRGNVCGAITAADLTVSDGTLVLPEVHNPRMHGLWFAAEDLLESAAATCMVRRAATFMRTGFTTARPGEYLSAVGSAADEARHTAGVRAGERLPRRNNLCT